VPPAVLSHLLPSTPSQRSFYYHLAVHGVALVVVDAKPPCVQTLLPHSLWVSTVTQYVPHKDVRVGRVVRYSIIHFEAPVLLVSFNPSYHVIILLLFERYVAYLPLVSITRVSFDSSYRGISGVLVTHAAAEGFSTSQ
jgi:hypothetical protein